MFFNLKYYSIKLILIVMMILNNLIFHFIDLNLNIFQLNVLIITFNSNKNLINFALIIKFLIFIN